MGKVAPITEQFQHFVGELQESFWGDLNGKARAAMQQLLESESRRQRECFFCREAYARREVGGEHRDGYYEREIARRLGTLRLPIARPRGGRFCRQGGGDFSGGPRRCCC